MFFDFVGVFTNKVMAFILFFITHAAGVNSNSGEKTPSFKFRWIVFSRIFSHLLLYTNLPVISNNSMVPENGFSNTIFNSPYRLCWCIHQQSKCNHSVFLSRMLLVKTPTAVKQLNSDNYFTTTLSLHIRFCFVSMICIRYKPEISDDKSIFISVPSIGI